MHEKKSTANINTVYWIDSLPQNERGPIKRMTESVEDLCQKHSFGFEYTHVARASQLEKRMIHLWSLCSQYDLKPILVLDMHGDSSSGVYLEGGDQVSWGQLSGYLRGINDSTGNNLIVIASVCSGIQLIADTEMKKLVPFFALIAPQNEVTTGFVEDQIPSFFSHLFQTFDITESYKMCLKNQYSLFLCQKMFLEVMAKYVVLACKGKRKQRRKEYLLTEALKINPHMDKTFLRERIRDFIKPDQKLIDNYSKVFLGEKSPLFTYEELIDHIESNYKEYMKGLV